MSWTSLSLSAKVKRRRGEEGKAGEMAHDMETRAKHVWEKRENTLTWALRPLKYHTIPHVMEFLRVSVVF